MYLCDIYLCGIAVLVVLLQDAKQYRYGKVLGEKMVDFR